MKVFQMNDCDWYMAESAEEAQVEYGRDYDPGDPLENQPRELEEYEMNTLTFTDDDGDLTRTFAEELKIRLSGEDVKHGIFASTEY